MRNKKTTDTKLTVRVPPETLKSLKVIAAEHDTTMQALANAAFVKVIDAYARRTKG